MTVEVDPEAWATEYGTGTDAAEVREDVKRYIIGGVDESPAPVTVVKSS